MKTQIALALSIINALLSCTENTHTDKTALTETSEIIELEVSKDIYIYSRCFRYYNDNDSGFIAFSTNHYNKDFDEIVCYNLITGKEHKRIPVYKKGANSIGCPLGGFDFITKDSIAVTNCYDPIYHFINSDGEKTYTYRLNDENATYASIESTINCTHAPKKDTIIFSQRVPYSRPSLAPNPTNFKFSNCPLAYIVNTKDQIETPSKTSFPKLYPNDKHINHNESYSRIFDGENFVYGFLTYDSLIVTSDHKTAKTYCAKSRYIGDVKNPGTPPGTAIPDIMRKLSTLASYGNIIYDPYREVYYRFCYFENDYPGPYTLEYTLSGGAFTIMIIDKEFNVIGETVFPDKRYASKIFFVNKDGLWLSENHFLREDMTDDKLVFRCLQLEYIQE